MSIETIHLRKLLELAYLDTGSQTSKLRNDIRNSISAAEGGDGGGPDFYTCFWADAKAHVANRGDLTDAVADRIQRNGRRSRLYPMLRDGFLEWWNERRRWTNEPFQLIDAPKARLDIRGLGTLKLENVLAVRDAGGVDHFVYPYFCERPPLSNEAARLGLWVLGQRFPRINPVELRILDVVRGATFAIDRAPLEGDEEAILRRRYSSLISRWRELRVEYP